jgi:hypothetical protein
MEIFSMRSSQNLHFKNTQNNARNSKTPDIEIATGTAPSASFKLDEYPPSDGPDFTAVSASELRSYARQSYDSGELDQGTFAAISEPLPMHAIDAQGNVLDLTGVTDGTAFNFRDYYENQLQIAMSLGDTESQKMLKSIVDFVSA